MYEGKAKRVYSTDKDDLVIIEYKDDATAFDGKKRGVIEQKGIANNLISNQFFKLLEKEGIRTHFVKQLSDRDTLVKLVKIIPIEVIVRNRAAGSLCKRLGLTEGTQLTGTVLEYCLKNDELGDPMINEHHIYALKLATAEELRMIASMSLKVNEILKNYLIKINLELIDFKLEFGRFAGEIILADEISPDTCRLWDRITQKKLDKDRFRRDLGGVEEAYQEVLKRMNHGDGSDDCEIFNNKK
jgi:phosphoribosylaminoimidazole-succinocarboxamide synthase